MLHIEAKDFFFKKKKTNWENKIDAKWELSC